MKGYWNYAVNEVKSSKNFDIKCLDSPGTRKRKLAEEVAENGTVMLIHLKVIIFFHYQFVKN